MHSVWCIHVQYMYVQMWTVGICADVDCWHMCRCGLLAYVQMWTVGICADVDCWHMCRCGLSGAYVYVRGWAVLFRGVVVHISGWGPVCYMFWRTHPAALLVITYTCIKIFVNRSKVSGIGPCVYMTYDLVVEALNQFLSWQHPLLLFASNTQK